MKFIIKSWNLTLDIKPMLVVGFAVEETFARRGFGVALICFTLEVTRLKKKFRDK